MSRKPSRRAGIMLPLLLLVLAPAASAWAAEEGPDTDKGADHGTCQLTRIGTQFTRCDFLTGAGVPAPYWIPEQ